jgi:hypothetical protein
VVDKCAIKNLGRISHLSAVYVSLNMPTTSLDGRDEFLAITRPLFLAKMGPDCDERGVLFLGGHEGQGIYTFFDFCGYDSTVLRGGYCMYAQNDR